MIEARASSARLGRLNASPTLHGKSSVLLVGQALSPAMVSISLLPGETACLTKTAEARYSSFERWKSKLALGDVMPSWRSYAFRHLTLRSFASYS